MKYIKKVYGKKIATKILFETSYIKISLSIYNYKSP